MFAQSHARLGNPGRRRIHGGRHLLVAIQHADLQVAMTNTLCYSTTLLLCIQSAAIPVGTAAMHSSRRQLTPC